MLTAGRSTSLAGGKAGGEIGIKAPLPVPTLQQMVCGARLPQASKPTNTQLQGQWCAQSATWFTVHGAKAAYAVMIASSRVPC